jgi:hypothetical protein
LPKAKINDFNSTLYQNMNAKLTIGIIGCTLLTVLTPGIINAQPSNLNFGTSRVPRQNCPPQIEPRSGAISAAQATLYATCNGEKKKNNHSVQFVDIRDVRVVRSREVARKDVYYFGSKIDTGKPVYDITGNVTSYYCSAIIPGERLSIHRAGTNCNLYLIPEALGTCVKTVFSKWECRIDTATQEYKQVPPPAS